MAYTHGSAGVGGNGATGPGRTGYNQPAAYASAITGQPAFNWENGVPSAPTPPLLTPGFGAGFTTTNPAGAVGVTYVDPDLSGKPPYYIDWSFGLQREIPGDMTAGATYSASVGHFLPRNGDNGIWTNSMHPQYLPLGTLLAAQATPAESGRRATDYSERGAAVQQLSRARSARCSRRSRNTTTSTTTQGSGTRPTTPSRPL